MFIQNLEFYETNSFEYLLIHKTGCQSVLRTFDSINVKVTMNQNKQSGKFCWTVLRDPMDRFISGLCHNLSLSNIELNKLDLKQLLFNVIHPNLRSVSLTPLTVLQTTYLIGSKVDMFVSHRDLNNFLQINFNTSFHENKGSLVLKKKVKDYIEENKNFKKALDKYLQIDYFVYQQILNNNQFWYWQLGKVLKYET
jgi:hypothetical protein|tara:strand:- start:640 stop:1227 length:588 start_codon:yes stop_codon:yes gene_type:complete